ncbi:MAG TPA: sigma-54 dependent transcriptional regulator [Thermoanaerobaculia bacterium]|nr:sigma-54 dependent transcriptional regulator [Thermoanaerobaculia bacterium]
MATSTASLDILLVDDEPNIRRMMTLHLESRGHRVRAAASAGEAAAVSGERSFDVAFVDLRLGTESGLDLIPRLLAAAPGLKVVVITAYASVETAVEAMRRGAADYLEKPFTPAQIDLSLEKVTALSRLERKVQALEGHLAEADPAVDLDSASPAMQAALSLARQAAPGDARVLLRGESGTGKGVVAHAIHAWSPRRDRPFVTISCPALPAELLESELFGHVRGAFTGAGRDNLGRVAVAEGGTLLLDEIGDLPLALQPKLLRFIQDREYERVGDPTPRHADVRILAATNQALEPAVAAGRFREDLLYRLNVLTIEIPPLRERPQDLLPLARRFLAFFGRDYGKPGLTLAPSAERAILAHAWPGNVRELRNAVERAAMLAQGPEVGPELLMVKGTATATSPEPRGMEIGDLLPLAAVEEEHIKRVLARTSSLKEAAEVLGMDQATLWRRRKQYGM